MSEPNFIWLHVREMDAYLDEGDGDTPYVRRDPAVLAKLPETKALTAAALQRARVNYVRATGETIQEMRANLRADGPGQALIKMGDAVLVWANEGDLYNQHPPFDADHAAALEAVRAQAWNDGYNARCADEDGDPEKPTKNPFEVRAGKVQP
jgi:hypothetical protein